jgi:cell division protein FtsW (lipid II flippase)
VSARRLPIAARALLTLLGVAATSGSLLLSGTQLTLATQGIHAASWIALVLFAAAIAFGWLTLWAAAGRNPLGRIDPASPRARAPRRLVAARVCLVVAALLLVLFFAGLPRFPWRWQDTTVAITILAQFAAAAYAAITVTHRNPRGRWVALALGAWMPSQLVRTTYNLAHAPGNADSGPAVVWSFLLSWTCYAAAIVAALCVLSLRGAWPPRDTPAPDGVVS